MSILGKILAFLNILGVGGLLTMASLTYAKRQTWERANWLAELTKEGLPLDDKDAAKGGDTDKAAVPLIAKFGYDPVNDSVFKQLVPDPRPAMPTQVAEVDRVKKLLDAKLNEASDVRKKNIFLAKFLIPLNGNERKPDVYIDREFYLSMKTQLDDDKAFADFKKTLGDAIPIALESVRFDTKGLSFKKAFQDALRSLPGDDKWEMAQRFLEKLPRSGQSLEKAAEAGKQEAIRVETAAAKKIKAEEDEEKARSAEFVTRAEAKAAPTAENLQKLKDLSQAAQKAAQTAKEAREEAAKLPNPRIAAAVVFLQTVRADPKTDTIPAFVEDVVKETLDAVNEELMKRYDQVYKDAFEGKFPEIDKQLIRDHRREAIARYLLASIDVLDEPAVAALQAETTEGKKLESMIDLPSYKHFTAIVGIDLAIRALDRQQQGLGMFMGDLDARISDERYRFVDDHTQSIIALKTRAAEVARLRSRTAEILDQSQRQKLTADGEETRVKGYIDELMGSRALTATEMKKLMEVANGLNEVRITIRNAIRANDLNLRKITELEYDIQYLERKMAEKVKAEKDKKKVSK